MLQGFAVNRREYGQKKNPWGKYGWNSVKKAYPSKTNPEEEDLDWLL